MVEKRDSTVQRLKKLAEQEKVPSLSLQLEALGARFGLLSQREDWSNPIKRATAADLALRITEPEEPLQTAFELFGLDIENPYDWRRLIGHFAEAYFGSKKGAPKKWTEDQNAKLLSDRDFVIRKHLKLILTTSRRSQHKKILDLMRKEKLFSGRYESCEDNTLKKQIKRALEWEKESGRTALRAKPDSPQRELEKYRVMLETERRELLTRKECLEQKEAKLQSAIATLSKQPAKRERSNRAPRQTR